MNKRRTSMSQEEYEEFTKNLEEEIFGSAVEENE
jgi:predicted metal-binding transcription factor (methanogenesis marker protein 9)